MASPEESIMDLVNNVGALHDDKLNLFRKWIDEDDRWQEPAAFEEARALAAHFAEFLETHMVRGRYSLAEINEAAREMIEEFVTEERPKWSVVSEPERTIPPKPMTRYEIEQAQKYEEIAHKIGFERLKALLPVPPERIRAALRRGDRGLHSIPLRKWDAAANSLRIPGLAIVDKVALLKHVAAWHTD